ncbi:hypothetical protein OHV05_35440 (plasmid) [Kitasatospora sp. NBC_00070]|uniref:hypothetical protein n=1 Tax=Kitasatospora sp. NBC_00070 TaxID=2975962 RepID=UPI002F91411F
MPFPVSTDYARAFLLLFNGIAVPQGQSRIEERDRPALVDDQLVQNLQQKLDEVWADLEQDGALTDGWRAYTQSPSVYDTDPDARACTYLSGYFAAPEQYVEASKMLMTVSAASQAITFLQILNATKAGNGAGPVKPQAVDGARLEATEPSSPPPGDDQRTDVHHVPAIEVVAAANWLKEGLKKMKEDGAGGGLPLESRLRILLSAARTETGEQSTGGPR